MLASSHPRNAKEKPLTRNFGAVDVAPPFPHPLGKSTRPGKPRPPGPPNFTQRWPLGPRRAEHAEYRGRVGDPSSPLPLGWRVVGVPCHDVFPFSPRRAPRPASHDTAWSLARPWSHAPQPEFARPAASQPDDMAGSAKRVWAQAAWTREWDEAFGMARPRAVWLMSMGGLRRATPVSGATVRDQYGPRPTLNPPPPPPGVDTPCAETWGLFSAARARHRRIEAAGLRGTIPFPRVRCYTAGRARGSCATPLPPSPPLPGTNELVASETLRRGPLVSTTSGGRASSKVCRRQGDRPTAEAGKPISPGF